MNRRIPDLTGYFVNSKKSKCLLLLCIALMAFAGLDIASVAQAQALLPPNFVADNSLEESLNSRTSGGSDHSTSGEATNQQISNVLWATGKAPVVGSYRNVYISKKDATYLYNPADHSLTWHSDTTSGGDAFVLEYQRELNFDAGVACMFALSSSVAQWDGTVSQLRSCPKGLKVHFGIGTVPGITTNLVAISSDSSLLNPSTAGANKFDQVVANLRYTSNFIQQDVSQAQLSQVLWAGYGCTPHTTYNGRDGLTVPSAMANYYLTGKIYAVNQNGVARYHNRLPPGTDLTTQDHRLENLSAADVRDLLQSAVSGLPDAPAYAVICLASGDAGGDWGQLEVGFAAGNMLLQASAEGLGAYFTTQLTSSEQLAIQGLLGISSNEIPHAIVSFGVPEPMSLVFFLAGGAVLARRHSRKKRR